MNGMRRVIVLASVCALAGAGCKPTGPMDYSKAPGSFLSLRDLVAGHNANAAKVGKLWARAKVRATMSNGMGWGSTSALAEPNALLILAKPGSAGTRTDFVLIGMEPGVELFRLGVDRNDGLYYLWYNLGEDRRAWAGRIDLAGAPGVTRVPIDPMQLVEVLGVMSLPMPTPAAAKPAVVMRLEGRPPSYVVSYVSPQPVTRELKVWREVSFRWSDKQPPRPFRIRLFDASGLCRLVADVSEYRPIEWAGSDGEPPVMPTDLKIFWPEIKDVQQASELHIVLSDMSATREFKPAVFDFASHLPGGIGVERVDAAYSGDRKEPSRK